MADKDEVRMVPTKGVIVMRDGNRVRPEIGKAYPFTQDEVDQVNGNEAKGIVGAMPGALRKPANEDDGTATATKAASSTGKRAPAPSAEKSQAEATGGKKRNTANKSDAEAEKADKTDADDDL